MHILPSFIWALKEINVHGYRRKDREADFELQAVQFSFMSTIFLDEMPYLHLFKRQMQIILFHYDKVRNVKK